jgi:hypothetical protein
MSLLPSTSTLQMQHKMLPLFVAEVFRAPIHFHLDLITPPIYVYVADATQDAAAVRHRSPQGSFSFPSRP